MANKPAKPLYKDSNLHIIFGITLIAIMGVSSVTPAFPKIARELDISPEQVGLLITAFTLPGIFLNAFLGVLADRFGRRNIIVPSLFLFGVAGAACALVRDFELLLIFRFIQGVGGASLGSLNLTIIGDLYSSQNRATAMGYNASVLSMGTATYPVIGGGLATFGWHYPFLLPLLAIPVGLIVIFGLNTPEPRGTSDIRTYLSEAWKTIKRVPVIGVFILFTTTFIILYGPYLSYMPFLIENRFGGTSFLIGAFFFIGSIATAVTSSQLGKLTTSYSSRTLLRTSYVLYLISMLGMPLSPSIWILSLPVILFGVAQGLNIPTLQSLLAGFAPLENRAAVMSVNGMVLRLGQTLGPVIMGGIYSFTNLNTTFYAGMLVAVFMFVIAWGMLSSNKQSDQENC